MTLPVGIDLAMEYNGRLIFSRRQGGYILPGISSIRSGETIRDAAKRAARNYIGREVEILDTISLYGPGRAGLKDGCSANLLMSAKILGDAPDGWYTYFIKPADVGDIGMSPQQRVLMESYLRWRGEKGASLLKKRM